MDRLLRTTNVPRQFKDVAFADFDPRRLRHGDEILNFIETWDPTDAKPGLVFQGGPAKGKTMLASAVVNEYHHQFPLKDVPSKVQTILRQERLPVYFIQLAELISLQIRSFKLHDLVVKNLTPPEEYLEIDQLLQDLLDRVQVLVIDDVGKEHSTASRWSEDSFDLLVRSRHNKGLVTIYTTNLPLSRWATQYSESMCSFIRRSSEIVKF